MKKYTSRFGKYPIFHPMNFMVLIYALIFLIIGEFKNPLTYIGLMFSVVAVLSFVHHFWEKYYIENNIIYTKKINDENIIPIPEDAILVFSYTTTTIRYNDRFMVNVVVNDSNDTLQKLHSNPLYNQWESIYRFKTKIKELYDNQFVQGQLKNRYLYSFVFNQQNFYENFQNPKRTIIIPRSIYDKIELNEHNFDIIIDEKS